MVLPSWSVTTMPVPGAIAGKLSPSPVLSCNSPRINAETSRSMSSSEARDRIGALGADVMTSTPEQFAAYIKSEQAKWGQAIKESGARLD